MLILHRVRYFVGVHASGAGVENFFVESAAAVHLVGSAALFHVSGLQHVEVVGVDNLADVVRDYDDGAVFLDGVDGGFNLLGGDGVEAGGGLVEEDDGRIF